MAERGKDLQPPTQCYLCTAPKCGALGHSATSPVSSCRYISRHARVRQGAPTAWCWDTGGGEVGLAVGELSQLPTVPSAKGRARHLPRT